MTLPTLRVPFSLASVFFLAVTPLMAAEGWRDLFDGKSLDGWVQHSGKAKFYVEDGAIVGEAVADTGNSFLCPKETFGDFEFETEFKVDPMMNSGVMFRSEVFPEAREITVDGKQIRVAADRLHGYQCEIDMNPKMDRWWSGGGYDEGRRKWLFPGPLGGDAKQFTEQGRKISKPGEWNKLRILCVGPSIKTYINDELRADFQDSLTPVGLIGLQLHGIGKDLSKVGMKARFRNIRIREIKGGAPTADAAQNALTPQEKADGWRLLWDGKTSTGWRGAKTETFPARGWTIHDGLLSVQDNGGEESAGGGDIITSERFSNFELMVDFKITPGANSGIKYAVQPGLPAITGTGETTAVGSAIGCEFQILDDASHPDAKLGREGNRTMGSLYDLIPASADKAPNPIGQWNSARIVVEGSRVEHWLNGRKVVAYDRSSPAFREAVAASKYKNIPGFGEWPEGHILLQEHGNEVSYRNIKIRVASL